MKEKGNITAEKIELPQRNKPATERSSRVSETAGEVKNETSPLINKTLVNKTV